MSGPITERRVRCARPGEEATLLAIQRGASVAAFAHIYPPEAYPFPDGQVRAVWRAALADPAIEVYVAEIEGKPVGCLSIDGAWLRTLYVLPEHWSCGVGSMLLEHGLTRMRERGTARARLWTLEQNQSGRRFYENRGWNLTGETRVVPFPPNPIDVCYSLDLTPRDSR